MLIEDKVAKKRRKNLKHRYNLTPEQFDSILKKQKNCCAICKTETSLCVDHCHNSNKIRGLLCIPCNIMLGQAKDNLTTLKNAIKYLKKSR